MGDKYKLMWDYNLTGDMLKIRCSDEHIYEIEKFISWAEVGRHLPSIGGVDLINMNVGGRTELQKRQRLIALWEERNGDEATYDVLIDAMIKAQKLNEATKVCKLLRPDRPPPPKPPSSDVKPPNFNNIIEFKKRNGEVINILAKIGADYHQFGLKLLEDTDGNIMDDIIENCNGNTGKIKRQIVIDWVWGKGKKPITWETLAEVVSTMGLAVLAKDIRKATTDAPTIKLVDHPVLEIGRSHPSDRIFKENPGVSKDKLTPQSTLAVWRAVGADMYSRSVSIGRVLRLSPGRIEEITRLHRSLSRRAVSIIDTWLRGNYSADGAPYTIPANTPHPSWWNLVWAVADPLGGNNLAQASTIARDYKKYQDTSPQPQFQGVSNEVFTEVHEVEIAKELEPVSNKWYEIGVSIKLPVTTLDTLGRDGEGIKMMIRKWIRDGPAEATAVPCWMTLVHAVDAPYGGHSPALAKILAEAHPALDLADDNKGESVSIQEAELIVKRLLEQEGTFKQKNMVVVLTGLMEAGKSTLLRRLFGEDCSKDYTSTGAVEGSWRGLTHKTLDVDEFKHLSLNDIFKLVAPLLRKLLEKSTDNVPPGPEDENVIELEGVEGGNSGEDGDITKEGSVDDSSDSEDAEAIHEMARFITNEDGDYTIELASMIDTGGQPECLEVLPTLLHNSDLTLLVVNLKWMLIKHCKPTFHKDGERFRKHEPLLHSNKQMIEQVAHTVVSGQSNSKILVVATHRDEDMDGMRLKNLNNFLRTAIPSSHLLAAKSDKEDTGKKVADKKVADREDADKEDADKEDADKEDADKEVAFDVNLANPQEYDKEMLKCIQECIKGATKLVEPTPVPPTFVLFESEIIQELTEKKKRHVKVLTFQECVHVGKRLKMNSDVVRSALLYFHKNNIFLFFEHFEHKSPELSFQLVFLEPQALINFVNKIVSISYTDDLESSHPLMQGFITDELFQDERMKELFVPGTYEAHHALKIFMGLYCIAEVSKPQQSKLSAQPKESEKLEWPEELKKPKELEWPEKSERPKESEQPEESKRPAELIQPKLGKAWYIMMCLLPRIKNEEFEDKRELLLHRSVKPLYIQFGGYCVPNGCFGNTVACLLSNKFNWTIFIKDTEEPEMLTHDIVTLQTKSKLKVSIVCRLKHFEVYGKEENGSQELSLVREEIFEAIRMVFNTMKIDKIKLLQGFKCNICKSEDHVITLPEHKFAAISFKCNEEMSALSEEIYFWIRDAPILTRPGIAILVTCDYKGTPKELSGTNEDARLMEEAFVHFNYDIHKLANGEATETNINSLVERVSAHLKCYDGTQEQKVIIFAFSGHGGDEDQIIANDFKRISVYDKIVKPFTEHKAVARIPKLFLIDACRGKFTLVDKTLDDERTLHTEGNYRIEYPTIPHFKAFMNTDGTPGSRWMTILAKTLINGPKSLQHIADEEKETLPQDCSFQHLAAWVRMEVYEKQKANDKQQCDMQQCMSVCRLNTGPLYLHSKARGCNCHSQQPSQ